MKFKNLLRVLIGFGIAFVFLILAFRSTNLADLWRTLTGVRIGWIALLVPVVVLSHWIRAVRWSHLLEPVKAQTSRQNLFSAVMIGYAVNNILPRVGELVRPFVIGRLENISKSSAMGTVIVERILDFVTFYFMVCLVLALYPSALDPFVPNPSTLRPVLLAASALALVVLVILFLRAEVVLRFLSRVKRFAPTRHHERFDAIFDSFITGFGVAKRKDKLLLIVVQSLAIWGFYALSLYVPFFAFDAMAALHLDIGAAVVLLTISSIAWVLPAPGAMGTYHSFLTIALVKLYGLDSATALGFAIVTHEVGYVIVMVVGVYYYVKDHIRVSEIDIGETPGEQIGHETSNSAQQDRAGSR